MMTEFVRGGRIRAWGTSIGLRADPSSGRLCPGHSLVAPVATSLQMSLAVPSLGVAGALHIDPARIPELGLPAFPCLHGHLWPGIRR